MNDTEVTKVPANQFEFTLSNGRYPQERDDDDATWHSSMEEALGVVKKAAKSVAKAVGLAPSAPASLALRIPPDEREPLRPFMAMPAEIPQRMRAQVDKWRSKPAVEGLQKRKAEIREQITIREQRLLALRDPEGMVDVTGTGRVFKPAAQAKKQATQESLVSKILNAKVMPAEIPTPDYEAANREAARIHAELGVLRPSEVQIDKDIVAAIAAHSKAISAEVEKFYAEHLVRPMFAALDAMALCQFEHREFFNAMESAGIQPTLNKLSSEPANFLHGEPDDACGGLLSGLQRFAEHHGFVNRKK